MLLDILNINKYIKDAVIGEVSSMNIYNPDGVSFNDTGLGSVTIFGDPTRPERKFRMGYINLNDIFIHPFVFTVISRLRRDIIELSEGRTQFKVENKKLIKLKPDETYPKSGTGVKWLYSMWDEIDWSPVQGGAKGSNDQREFLVSLKKEEVFIDKWMVLPAFFRDIDIQSNKKNEFNTMYLRMLGLASSIKETKNIFYNDMMVTKAHIDMQRLLLEIMNFFTSMIGGNKGFIHKHIMGKSQDFSARLVISAPNYNSNTAETVEVDFHTSAIPLSTVISIFAPFIKFGVKRYVLNKINSSEFIMTENENGQFVSKKLAEHWGNVLQEENLSRLIKLYTESPDHRLDLFEVELEDGSMTPIYYTDDRLPKKSKPINLTELFYIVACDTVQDKHIYITRYPITDYNSIYPSKISIIPSNKYRTVVIDNKNLYKHFPDFSDIVDEKNIDYNTLFTDTLRIFPTYAAALGADYDGDQVSIQSVFTDEANSEADKMIKSTANIANIAGSSMRETGQVTAHTIYGLTYKNDKKSKMLNDEEKKYILSILHRLDDDTRNVMNELFSPSIINKKIVNPKFRASDKINLKKGDIKNLKNDIETTIGSLFFNYYVLVGAFGDFFEYNNNVLKTNDIRKISKDIVSNMLENKLNTDQYFIYTNRLLFIGYFSELFVPGITSELLYAPKELRDLKAKLIHDNQDVIDNNDVIGYNKKIEEPLMKKAEELVSDLDAYRLFSLGAKPQWGNNYKNNVVGVGVINDLLTGEKRVVPNSYMEGNKVEDRALHANVSVFASYSRGVSTQDGGAMTKYIYSAMQTVVLDMNERSDCGTTHYYNNLIIKNNQKELYLYRYIYDENDKIILLSPDVIEKYLDKPLRMRTPLYCFGVGNERKICNICFGDSYRRIGIDKAGFTTTQISGTILNLSMKKMHSMNTKTYSLDVKKYFNKLR